MTQDKWLAERLAYLRGLKAPSDQQRLLLMLADKPDRTADEEPAFLAAPEALQRVFRGRLRNPDTLQAGVQEVRPPCTLDDRGRLVPPGGGVKGGQYAQPYKVTKKPIRGLCVS